ncbi:MAG: hypothetical protein GY812_06185 [Actinomycetia bacterium]|nr:hypothetical protein [Actinomycetes bacterium]
MPICESCGREEREVTKVQRVYLVADDSAEADASPAGIEAGASPTAGDIEMWCASCCATFPHSVIDAE